MERTVTFRWHKRKYCHPMLLKILNIIALIFSIILILTIMGFLTFPKELVIVFILISVIPSFYTLIQLLNRDIKK